MNDIFLVVAFFGFVVTTLLITKRAGNKLAKLFLASFYFIYSIYTLQTYIINGGLIEKFTWFYVWPLPLYSLIIVPIYFYFIAVIKDEFKWKWQYVIIFVPFLLSIIDVVIVYSKSSAFYDQIVQGAVTSPAKRFTAQYGLFNLNEHFSIRHLWQLIYLASLWPMLRKFLGIASLESAKTLLNRWLLLLYISLSFMALITTFNGIERMLGADLLQIPDKSLFVIYIILTVVLLVISIIPLYFPSILYGFPRDKNYKYDSIPLTKKSLVPKYGLDTEKLTSELMHIEEQGLFVKQDFDLNMCAQELEIQPHHLSYFFNQEEGVSFNTYRNTIRMNKAKMLIEDGFLDLNTTEALALECGFASRSAFSKTFKKITKMNVSKYLSNIKN